MLKKRYKWTDSVPRPGIKNIIYLHISPIVSLVCVDNKINSDNVYTMSEI